MFWHDKCCFCRKRDASVDAVLSLLIYVVRRHFHVNCLTHVISHPTNYSNQMVDLALDIADAIEYRGGTDLQKTKEQAFKSASRRLKRLAKYQE